MIDANTGRKCSDETKKKISSTNKLKGIRPSKECHQKSVDVCTGKPTWNKDLKTGPLSPDHRKKIGEASTGRVMLEVTKQKISFANKGRKFTDIHKQRISEAHIGKPNPNKGKPLSDEVKNNMRIAAYKRMARQVAEGSLNFPSTGIKEKICLDELQNYSKYNIVRQFPCLPCYSLDGYIKELNLVVSFYEHNHKYSVDYDNNRFDVIKGNLNCEVLIIWEHEWDNDKPNIITKFISTQTMILEQTIKV
jgi:very-short-patch-repair endonuclease